MIASADITTCKPLSYCFEETIGFDIKALFARCVCPCCVSLNQVI